MNVCNIETWKMSGHFQITKTSECGKYPDRCQVDYEKFSFYMFWDNNNCVYNVSYLDLNNKNHRPLDNRVLKILANMIRDECHDEKRKVRVVQIE